MTAKLRIAAARAERNRATSQPARRPRRARAKAKAEIEERRSSLKE